MSNTTFDIAIVGGGLAGGLTALALHRYAPQRSFAVFEAGETLGGNHRWSWFEGDLDAAGAALVEGCKVTRWDDGHEVRFPAYTRRLAGRYRSLDSRDFDTALRRTLPQNAVRTNSRVKGLDAAGITLDSGDRVSAKAVIDCRDAAPSEHLTGGWQVFLGQHLRTGSPHGIVRPVIMDATVDQVGAYRFIYLLPLAADEIFVEDTYYADRAQLDPAQLRSRIGQYAEDRDWKFDVIQEETGILPVIDGGDIKAYRAALAVPGVALAGARGGFVHPLTSYTMPIAAENAVAIAHAAATDLDIVADFVERRASAHWKRTGYYRLLAKMLFEAADPEERYRIFERFYRLPEPLIERFYAARSTPFDKVRILSGKPPVAVSRAVKALLGKGSPLVQR